MIGLTFLAVGLLWLALAFYLTVNLPRWLGLKKLVWPLRAVLLLLLLIGPFVDEIVGMRQFEGLCKARAVVWTSVDSGAVTRAKRGETKYVDVPNNWIAIRSQQIEYLNVDSGKPFLRYEILHTKGGHVASLALLGGEHSCSPPAPNAMNELNIDKLIEQGKS